MIYTALTKKAMRIAFEVHKEQTDKSGAPYIFHPMHLAEGMTDEATCCVALLHDVVEDGEVSFDWLLAEGFTEEIVDAIRLMTHAPEVAYADYVREIKKNPIARTVKLADLSHNSDLSRLEPHEIGERVLLRVEKYREAIRILREE